MFVIVIRFNDRIRNDLQNRGYQVNLILFQFREKANLNFKSGHQSKSEVCVFKKIQIFEALERNMTCRKT